VGLSFRVERDKGRQGISLAALAASVERALEECARTGIDPDTIEPVVRTTVGGNPRIKKLEIDLP
jgi:hypothetical protein